jgi:cobalt-zinc-cadmium efflux system protein
MTRPDGRSTPGHGHADGREAHGAHGHGRRDSHDHEPGHEHAGRDSGARGGHDHGHDHAAHGGAHDHRHDRAGHGRAHDHDHAAHDRGLGVAFWLIAAFTVIEGIGGSMSGSLALLADAGHMLVDTLALALAWGAHRLASRPASDARSFGHTRVQVLAAFVNSLLLLGIVAAIVLEAAQRLMVPHPVNAPLALGVALAGMLVNVFAAWLLHGEHHDLNVRAAYLHVVSDVAGSGAAVLAALLILYLGWLPADAWLSLVVAALIARGAWQLLRHSAHVLQEGTPEGFDAARLAERLKGAIPAVLDVHHVHAWSLTPRETLLTLHARLAPGADAAAALLAIKRVLVAEFGITHSTIQLEPADCADADQPCAGEAPTAA